VTGVPPEYLFGMMYKALVVEAESEGTRRLLDVGEDTDSHKHVMTKKTLGNLYAELWPETREKNTISNCIARVSQEILPTYPLYCSFPL
jgi:hypothetical protein